MNKRTLGTLLLLIGVHVVARAAGNENPISFGGEMIKVAINQERGRVFQTAMANLPQADQKIFWQFYPDYDREKSKIDENRVILMEKYVTLYATMTNEQALEIMDKWIKVQESELRLRKKMFKALLKKSSPLVASRFYQVDDYLQASLKLKGFSRLPMMGDPIQ